VCKAHRRCGKGEIRKDPKVNIADGGGGGERGQVCWVLYLDGNQEGRSSRPIIVKRGAGGVTSETTLRYTVSHEKSRGGLHYRGSRPKTLLISLLRSEGGI